MQQEANGNGENESGVRLFRTATLRFHNAHTKTRRIDSKCGFCETGVGAAIKEIESPEPEPDVVQGGGTDEKGDAAPAPDSRWPWGEDRPL